VRGDFYQFMADTLNSRRSRERGLFNRKYIDRLLSEPEQHFTRLNGSKLWHSALLEYWLQRHLKNYPIGFSCRIKTVMIIP
jgi:asparagine synthase (glutamine-hydrolysing)